MMRRVRALAFGLAAQCAIATALAAQTPAGQPDAIPRDLVEALLRQYVGALVGPTEFAVGKLPDDLAPFLHVPKNARILGGVASSQTTSAIFIAPLTMGQVVTEMTEELPKLGWTVPTDDPGIPWGFAPAPGSGRGGGLAFCHVGQSMQLTPIPLSNGATQVTATVQNFGGRCDWRVRFIGGRTPQPTMLPTLVNPTGVIVADQACAVGRVVAPGGTSIGERVRMSMTPTQLLDSFAKQLADSGWSASAPSATARRTWTKPDSGGTKRELILTATPLDVTGCIDVMMSVRQLVGPLR